MFSSSSQRKFWVFSNEEELKKYRDNANKKYIGGFDDKTGEELKHHFLSPEEELVIVRYHEKVLREFLQRFRPRNEALPKDVRGTAFHFYKRFFVVSSVMDYHPKEVMITCIFLSCKICEYNVPIDLFVKNIDGNQNMLRNIILDQELELLYRMNFKLNIHTPYRAIEGLILDLKTRSSLHQPERLYEHIHRFLSGMWQSDVCLLYSPSLIALASIMHAVSRCRENIDQFVMRTVLNSPPQHVLQGIISTVRKIRATVMSVKEPPSVEQVTQLEAKMGPCRNPSNDPNSKVFKQRMMEHALDSYGQ